MIRFVRKALWHGSAIGLGLAFVINAAPLTSQAEEQSINHPKHSVNVRLNTDVWGTSAAEGQIFEAQLPEDLHYKTWELPKGTVFRGEVTTVKHSKHFGRPGYVVLNVEEAQLPDGTRFGFDAYKPRNAKTHDKGALTFKQTVVQQLPTSLLGLGATLPITLTGAASGVSMIPVGVGVRMLSGSTFAMSRKSKYSAKPVPQRVAYGALDGSGLIRALGFVNKYPEPEYKAGDMIPLYFNPKGLHELFVASVEHDESKAMPLEPVGPLTIPGQSQPNNVVKVPSQQPTTATFP
jgi:hypothetical protein